MAAPRTPTGMNRDRLNRFARSVARGVPSIFSRGENVAADPSDPRYAAFVANNYREQSARRDQTLDNNRSVELNPGSINGGVYYNTGVLLSTHLGAVRELTVSAWYKKSASSYVGAFGAILGSSTDYSVWGDGFGVNVSGATTLQVWVNNASNASDITITSDQLWHHVVFSWDASVPAYYVWIDGTRRTLSGGSPPAVPLIVTGTQHIRAGQIGNLNVDSNAAFFSGRLDEIGLFTKRMSEAEALYLYNKGQAPGLLGPSAPDNLLNWWRFGDHANDNATLTTGVITDLGIGGRNLTPLRAGSRTGTSAFVADAP